MWTMKIIWFSCLAVVLAELPLPEGFAGYERGGYEIQTGSANTGALQFPGSQAGQKAFDSGQQSGDFQGSNEFSTGGGQGSGSNGQSQIGGFDSASEPGFGGFDSSSGQSGSQGQFGGSESVSEQSGSSFGGSNELGQRGSQKFNSGSGSNEGGNNGNNGNNGNDGDDDGDLGDIPGEPGKDYPIYGEIPKTSFKCQQQASPGYFADVETQCQVFHICQKGGQMDSVLCPNGTIFNQKVFVCSWWYDFDCDLAAGLFSLNEQVNAAGESAALNARQGFGRGGEGYSENGPGNGQAAGGYAENGPNNGESSEGYAENRPNNDRIIDGFSGNDQNLGGNTQQEKIGGNSKTGPSFGNDGGSAQEYFSSGGQRGERILNDFSGNSIDAFSGYSDNGPVYAQTGPQSGQNSQNGQNSRGTTRFEQSGRGVEVGQGYSDNRPDSVQLSGSSDLATSGDHFGDAAGFGNQQAGIDVAFGGNQGEVKSIEGGYPSKSNGNGNENGNEIMLGQNEGGAASSGYPTGRERNGDRDFTLPNEGRQTLTELIGGPSRRGNRVEGMQDVPSSEYLPPKEEGSLGESVGQQDRSYLPPGK